MTDADAHTVNASTRPNLLFRVMELFEGYWYRYLDDAS